MDPSFPHRFPEELSEIKHISIADKGADRIQGNENGRPLFVPEASDKRIDTKKVVKPVVSEQNFVKTVVLGPDFTRYEFSTGKA